MYTYGMEKTQYKTYITHRLVLKKYSKKAIRYHISD